MMVLSLLESPLNQGSSTRALPKGSTAHNFRQKTSQSFLIAMASTLLAMAPNLVAMASNLPKLAGNTLL